VSKHENWSNGINTPIPPVHTILHPYIHSKIDLKKYKSTENNNKNIRISSLKTFTSRQTMSWNQYA
jgi:hypothetical protein